MRIDIRTATASDSAALSALILRTIRATNSADYLQDEIDFVCGSFSPDKMALKIAARDVFMAISAGALAGTASYAHGRLHSLFVDPAMQKSGIGRALLAFVENHARAAGDARLALSSSLTAQLFYEKQGYQLCGEEASEGSRTLLMQKDLGGTRLERCGFPHCATVVRSQSSKTHSLLFQSLTIFPINSIPHLHACPIIAPSVLNPERHPWTGP